MSCAIVWFRKDLRLEDHHALAQAIEEGHQIVPLFIWAPHEESPWEPGGASRWWQHHALDDLHGQLVALGSRLVFRKVGDGESSESILRDVAKRVKAKAIYWNRRYEPAIISRDTQLKKALKADGFAVTSANSGMLFEPHEIANKSGKPYRVFTPMWRHYQTLNMPLPVQVDLKGFQSPPNLPQGESLCTLGLSPKVTWDGGFKAFWGKPTRKAMIECLEEFIAARAQAYLTNRDLPACDGTSKLSPYLHFGQIGPRELWWRLASAKERTPQFDEGIMRQLVWREFAHHLLYHFPKTPEEPLNDAYVNFPWKHSERILTAWQKGETGYPIVDAGMRQLWQTGWMHNRVRMIVGSLLVKHLLQHWHEGARWFWDTLVDADLPNNTMGWQWIGGCGADAAPYFRIFNPMIQGEKFDREGDYVRTSPVIPHADGRQQALDAFQKMKSRIAG